MEPSFTAEPARRIRARVLRRVAFIGALLAFNAACWWGFLTLLGTGAERLGVLMGFAPSDLPIASIAETPPAWIVGLLVLLHLALLAAGGAAVAGLVRAVACSLRRPTAA